MIKMFWVVAILLCGLAPARAATSLSRYTSVWSNSTISPSESSSGSPASTPSISSTSISAFSSTSSSTFSSSRPSTTLISSAALIISSNASSLPSSTSKIVAPSSNAAYGYVSIQPTVATTPHSPLTNSSSVPQNGTMSNSTGPVGCVAQCRNLFPIVTTWAWYRATEVPVTKTVTSYIYVNARTNKTSTSFSHEHVPQATTPVGSWQSIWTLTVERGESTVYPVITFPTPYVDYAASYSVIASPDESEIRVPTGDECATSSWFNLPSHPAMLQPPPATTPLASASGVVYGVGSFSLFATASPEFFRSEFPFEGAFSACKPYKRGGPSNGNPPAPSAVEAVQFLTETVVSTTSDEDAPTATPATGTDNKPDSPLANSKSSTTQIGFLNGIISKIVAGVSEASASQRKPNPTQIMTASIVNEAPSQDNAQPGGNNPAQQTAQPNVPQIEPSQPQVFVAPVGSETISLIALPNTDKQNGVQRSPTAFEISGITVPVDQTISISGTPVAVHMAGADLVLAVGQGPSVTTIPLQLLPNAAVVPPQGLVATNIVVGEATLKPVGGASRVGFSVAGSTLTNGGSITLGIGSPSTTVLALSTDNSGNTIIVANGRSSTIPPLSIATPSITLGPSLVLEGTTFSAINPSAIASPEFIISGQTLSLGGTITLGVGSSKTTLALATNAAGHTFIISNGKSSELASPTTQFEARDLLTLNGQVIAPTSIKPGSMGYLISGQTLTQGGSVTFAGTVFTLTTDAAGHTVVVSNGRVSLLPGQITPGPLTIGGTTVAATILPSGKGIGYVVGGQTLTLGGSITTSGTVVTLTTDGTGHTILVENGRTSTVPLGGAPVTTTNSLPLSTSGSPRSTAVDGRASQTSRGGATSSATAFRNDRSCWCRLWSFVGIMLVGTFV